MIAILLQCLQFGISEIVPIEQLAEKLKSIFTLDPNAKVNIQHLGADAIEADDETLADVAAWQQAHGLPITVPVPAPAPAPVVDIATGKVPTPAGSQLPAASSDAASGSASAPAAGTVSAAEPAAGGTSAAVVGETGDHGHVGDLGTNSPK